MISRRSLITRGTAALAGGLAWLGRSGAGASPGPAASAPGTEPTGASAAPSPEVAPRAYTPVETPNGSSLPWVLKDGVKEFHLVAEPVKREFAPGMTVNCWGYNGQTPGPTIEAVEGDRVRVLVTNRLPEPTSVHWHGLIVPNGMDGVAGVTQKPIAPGETCAYEFTLKQHGTQMYHPHTDEMIQMALGMQGFFVIHPRDGEEEPIDRDFCLFLQEWAIAPGTATPNPNVMLDFNLFTFNSRSYPGTDPLVVKTGDRVRIRLANLSMDSHPIHFHGHVWWTTYTDGGMIPKSARWPGATANVPPGETRTLEFVADNPGDWPLHCHKNHHAMNAMTHDIPNVVGADAAAFNARMQKLVPGYMSMGGSGMDAMSSMRMGLPRNTLPMMAGQGQFGPVGMGGMFTLLKVRDTLPQGYGVDPGPYQHPPGTVATAVSGVSEEAGGKEGSRAETSGSKKNPVHSRVLYTCVMHPEVVQDHPGKCPKCGMTLVLQK